MEHKIASGIYIDLHLKSTRDGLPTFATQDRAFSVNVIRFSCVCRPNSPFFLLFAIFFRLTRRDIFPRLTRKERRELVIGVNPHANRRATEYLRLYLPCWRKCNKYLSRHARAETPGIESTYRRYSLPRLRIPLFLRNLTNVQFVVLAALFSLIAFRLIILSLCKSNNCDTRIRIINVYFWRYAVCIFLK